MHLSYVFGMLPSSKGKGGSGKTTSGSPEACGSGSGMKAIRRINLEAPADLSAETVGQFRERVAALVELPPQGFHLLFRGRLMREDGQSLASYNIQVITNIFKIFAL